MIWTVVKVIARAFNSYCLVFIQLVLRLTKLSLLSGMDVYDGLQFEENDLAKWVEDSKAWAFTHGIVIKDSASENLVNFVPFMLFPSPFPKDLFDQATRVQNDFQLLYHRASKDHLFLSESLKNVIVHDDFTRRLYRIYDAVRAEGCRPRIHFNITRSDYMIDQRSGNTSGQPYCLRQIEMNMIAAGMACIGSRVGKLHQFMADVMGDKCPYEKEKLPIENAASKLGSCLAVVWCRYAVEDAVIVFVVTQGERNRFDQKLFEYSFHESINNLGFNRHVPVLFCTLEQLFENSRLTNDNRFLFDGQEVAAFYFRSGYSPDNYNDKGWKARYLIERSMAVKCPTVAEQLVGTKKIQQVLATPGMVERFIDDEESVQRIRSTFAGLFSLDPGTEGDAAVTAALAQPSKYVLKPQREGGGNNLYDKKLVHQLHKTTYPGERSQFILMDRVNSPTVNNYMVHPNTNRVEPRKTVSELGVFGVFISDVGEEVFDSSCGYLMRSKSVEDEEGGIMAGKAGVDTPYLI